MLESLTYKNIIDQLSDSFRHRYSGDRVRMIGILFARPASMLARDEIVPALNDFYHRSASHIDFFLPGYGMGGEHADYAPVDGSRGNYWLFSSARFDSVRREVESRTSWRYSGATDLILANAHAPANEGSASVDFDSTIVCQLDRMKADGAIESAEIFFEQIFRFAENYRGTDPTWGFSDSRGIRNAGSALRRVVLSLLPESLTSAGQKAAHFAIRNVGLPRRPRFSGLWKRLLGGRS